MWKQYKKQLILSSLAILLPALFGLIFWDQLPALMPTHWGTGTEADGFSSKAFAVFALPPILLAAQWLCLFATRLDPKNKDQNRKPMTLILWIMPAVSLLVNAVMYSAALGYTMHLGAVMMIPMGLMFVVIGNYLPKYRQNYTMGIKIKWTLANEENWNLTHRFGGKCWVIGGIVMALCAFLPGKVSIWVMLAGIFLLVLAPVLYSWRIYRRHRTQGIEYSKVNAFGSKKAGWVTTVFLLILLAFLVWIMFTGDIAYVLGEDSFTVEADFYTDLTVSYDSIVSIEFREGNIPGIRTSGFQSARLLMGFFQNEEFGAYTRYTYTNPDACIVIRSGSKTLVLSTEAYSETLKLYLRFMEYTSLS
jgi:uncharacterized membrane protein